MLAEGISHWLPLLIIGNMHDSEYNVNTMLEAYTTLGLPAQ